MTAKILSIRAPERLTCFWTSTTDPRMPLIRVWMDERAPQPAAATSHREEPESRCA